MSLVKIDDAAAGSGLVFSAGWSARNGSVATGRYKGTFTECVARTSAANDTTGTTCLATVTTNASSVAFYGDASSGLGRFFCGIQADGVVEPRWYQGRTLKNRSSGVELCSVSGLGEGTHSVVYGQMASDVGRSRISLDYYTIGSPSTNQTSVLWISHFNATSPNSLFDATGTPSRRIAAATAGPPSGSAKLKESSEKQQKSASAHPTLPLAPQRLNSTAPAATPSSFRPISTAVKANTSTPSIISGSISTLLGIPSSTPTHLITASAAANGPGLITASGGESGSDNGVGGSFATTSPNSKTSSTVAKDSGAGSVRVGGVCWLLALYLGAWAVVA